MNRKKWLIGMGSLCVLLVVAGVLAIFWGMRANTASARLEQVYQSALVDTVDLMGSMSVKLEKVLLTVDNGNNVILLSQIASHADSAQKNLSLLPLAHDATAPLMQFCAQTTELSAVLSKQLANGDALTQEQEQQLTALRDQCTLLMGQIYVAQDQMQKNDLVMQADESVFYDTLSAQQRPLESIGDKDNGMDYPTLIYDGAFSDARHRGDPKGLGEDSITKAQAIEIAKAFVGTEGIESAVETASQTGVIPSYGVQVTKNGQVLTMEITQKGGKVLLMMPENAAFEAKLSLDEAKEKAQAFLESRGFGKMNASFYQMYDGLAVMNFASVQDGVTVYPDMVKVQVRLDTGDVVGIEANNYWMNHAARKLDAPKISEQQAREKISQKLSLTDTQLCVIPYLDKERLCYEFSGTYLQSEYKVYIDALTGQEVELLKIVSVENGVLSV